MFDLPAYPGRGIAVHRHHDGRLEWLYVLTGRSPASRERSLVAAADRVTVVPVGEGEHDPLRHYSCVRSIGPVLVIGNGDHVDHLADGLAAGHPLDDELLAAIDPEPDPPIHTPRIAVVADSEVRVVAVQLVEGAVERRLERFELDPGEGIVVHTYGGDTTAVTTDAQVRRFDAGGPGTDVAGRLWHALDPALRV